MACALSSCENDNHVIGSKDELTPITFSIVETRADITEGDIVGNGFGIYAFKNNGAEGSAEASAYESLFGNEAEKVYKDDSGSWTYDDIKFWDANRLYHFFGVYPYNALYSITKDISGNPTGITRSFTTPDTANEDIVAAYAKVNSAESTPASVEMNFKHLLAKVYFEVFYDTTGNKDDEFTLKEFSISNIKKEGTLQSNIVLQSDIDDSNSWSVNPLQNLDFKWGGEYEFGEEISLWEDGLMLIPQTIAPNAVNIKVKYTYVDNYVNMDTGEEISADPVEKEVDTYLPAITWKPGVKYTYKMVLHEDDIITFRQIDVAPWGSPQQGGAIIIK